jgi:hypothetical protein
MEQATLERIGQLADKADFLTYSTTELPFPPKIHLEQLAIALGNMRDELRDI